MFRTTAQNMFGKGKWQKLQTKENLKRQKRINDYDDKAKGAPGLKLRALGVHAAVLRVHLHPRRCDTGRALSPLGGMPLVRAPQPRGCLAKHEIPLKWHRDSTRGHVQPSSLGGCLRGDRVRLNRLMEALQESWIQPNKLTG